MKNKIILEEEFEKDVNNQNSDSESSREEAEKHVDAIRQGKEVPVLVSDVVFKAVFYPGDDEERESKKWLSKFISSILGEKVTVIRGVSSERSRQTIYSKGVILDIVVRLESGELADVEIQREGFRFPSRRAAMYSSRLLTDQYAAKEGQKKSEVNYDVVNKVYTIVIIEKSTEEFKGFKQYHHYFQQKSNTGLELEHLQYYHYICLDIYKKHRPYIADAVNKWLEFLTIREVSEMEQFLEEYPDFIPMYNKALGTFDDVDARLAYTEYLMNTEDVIGSMRITNESIIKRLEKENAEKDEKLAEKDEKLAEKDAKIVAQSSEIAEKDSEIARLKAELASRSEDR